ncbi:MAG: hypothetical protein N2508_13585 [Anaerolineae bacterium]|nr:hypothetical protein [Anaerolineae bacterium]
MTINEPRRYFWLMKVHLRSFQHPGLAQAGDSLEIELGQGTQHREMGLLDAPFAPVDLALAECPV